METARFQFSLPPELIAQEPLPVRSDSRLLVLHRSTRKMEHRIFRDIVSYLEPGDALVLNNARVIPARLRGRKIPTGGAVEVLLLKPLNSSEWLARMKPGRRLHPGTRVQLNADPTRCLEVISIQEEGSFRIAFHPPLEFSELTKIGEVPLPPYIHKKLSEPERYQTVYAKKEGALAAPTAGLHFDRPLLRALEEKGVILAEVTLFLSESSFLLLKNGRVEDHQLQPENYVIDEEATRVLNQVRQKGKRVVAVGTSTVRVLESAVGKNSLLSPCQAQTSLFIYPGFAFQVTDALITNFHLPGSTHLLLVCAFGGIEAVLEAYQVAVAHRYRFYSFGDAMLVL